MAATRMQVCLTAEQRDRLDARAHREGKALAELIREAVDAYLEQGAPDPHAALGATFGSLPDLAVPSRGGWGRST